MKTVRVRLDKRTYEILIQSGILNQAGKWIRNVFPGSHAVIVSDQTVSRLYGARVQNALEKEGFQTSIHMVPDGENSKSSEQLQALYDAFLRVGLKRDGLVIALGGGVVGDLAGFAAATFLRGVPLVQIPTTLLAQVDSSVGGKVGINHPLGKNLIGSFYQPKCVLIDPEVLQTLPPRELWAGAGEVIKYALIRDGDLFRLLESHLEKLFRLEEMDLLESVITRCCQIKAWVVEQDETETELRRILNFGHTLGHALEAETQYRYFRHGETVVYGMQWATQLSCSMGLISEKDSTRIQSVLERFPLPPVPKFVTLEGLMKRIGVDKKQTATGLRVVLLKRIGKASIVPAKELDTITRMWLEGIRHGQKNKK